MYKSYFGYCVGNCVIQKTIRIDKSTYEIIRSVAPGNSFSDQVRTLAHKYRSMTEKNPGKK